MEQNPIILCTPDQIKKLVRETMEEYIQPLLQKASTQTKVTSPEKLCVDQVLDLLSENGYPTTKGNVYKMTSQNQMPCARIGKRLIFFKTQILAWLESRSVSKNTSKEKTIMSVAKSARNTQHLNHENNERR